MSRSSGPQLRVNDVMLGHPDYEAPMWYASLLNTVQTPERAALLRIWWALEDLVVAFEQMTDSDPYERLETHATLDRVERFLNWSDRWLARCSSSS